MYLLSALVVLAVIFEAVSAAAPVGTCLTGSTPFELSTFCAPGYYCPLYNASDNSTFPVQCAATNDCVITRLTTKFCSAQGTYEPVLCKAGNYCPSTSEQIECPEDHYCPIGQYEPIKCGAMTTCDAGSSKKQEWGSLLALGIGDIAAVILYFFLLWYKARQQQSIKDRCAVIPINISIAEEGDAGRRTDSINLIDVEGGKLPKGQRTATEVLCEGFKRARGKLPLMILEFEQLSLTIPGDASKGRKPLTILTGVTGSIRPGKVTAIMGPSGAGKTTLLNCLLGKQDGQWELGGSLLINGQRETMTRFRTIVGYVPQDDIMHRDLTVYENIAYAANIRLPRDWTTQQRNAMIDATISAMQLSHVQHVAIGDETVRGVSGGQRKRVNIGMEVVAAPSLLLLDEPTSGLDSTAAMEICGVLKQLAAVSGITVAMVIHQPRLEIWQQLDELLLLAKGGFTVYQGPQRLSEVFFAKYHDVHLQPQDNPADALMDIIASRGPHLVEAWQTQQGPEKVQVLLQLERDGKLGSTYANRDAPASSNVYHSYEKGTPSSKSSSSNSIAVEEADFLKWQAYYAGELESKIAQSTRMGFPSHSECPHLRHTASFFRQWYLACVRSLWKQFANLSSLWLEIGLALFASGVMGSLATMKYQGILTAPYTLLSPTPLEGLIADFFFTVGLAISLSAASAGVSVFGEELVIYRREVAAGHNHLAYFLGVVLAQYPRLLLDTLHFAPLVHYLAQPLTPFSAFFVVVFQLYCAIYGMAFLVSFLVSRKNAALLAVVLSLMFSSMTAKGGIPEGIQFLSPSRWAVEALFDYETRPYRHIMDVTRSADDGGYTLGRVPLDLALMFIMGIFYRVLAYIAMRFVDRKIIIS
eukprot:gene15814-11317_t